MTVSASTKKTAIAALSAIVGIATVSSLVYLYIRKDRLARHDHQLKALQRSLTSQLLKIDDQLEDLLEGDIRLAKVRIKTLRTHRLYPSDDHVQLPSLGLINNNDKQDLGSDFIEETPKELVRERTQGFDQPFKARQGYKDLDRLLRSTHKRLLGFLSRADAIDLAELAELGDETGGAPEIGAAELHIFAKVQKRRRQLMNKIQEVLNLVDRLSNTIEDRLDQVKAFEKLQKVGLEPEDEVEPTIDSEKMKQGISFAQVASLNIEEPEVLAPTEDLERMNEGVTFAQVAAPHNTETDHDGQQDNEHEQILVHDAEVLAPTKDLEKMKHGFSYADAVAEEP
ncbi:hypothetical protein BG004_007847 [Podila humilis]|nr:hypothetical protein BG004_007847 [Podila humilis]